MILGMSPLLEVIDTEVSDLPPDDLSPLYLDSVEVVSYRPSCLC